MNNKERELSDIFDPNRKNQSIVVRITNFCNNHCEHCCFECGPECDLFMSPDIMELINTRFADTKDVCYWFNVMGGEPTLHPNYENLIETLAGRHVRFVTNGWWINNERAKNKFITFLKRTKAIMHVGVSRDKFHPAGVGEKAFKYLMDEKIDDDFGLSAPNPEDEEGAVASVGRAYWNYIGYMRSTFGAYCLSSNTRNTSFTVLEDGTVTHCPFGIWPIGNVSDSIEDLYEEKIHRTERWNEISPSCRSCYEVWLMKGRIKIAKDYPIFTKN